MQEQFLEKGLRIKKLFDINEADRSWVKGLAQAVNTGPAGAASFKADFCQQL
ncbi:hypothetical protein XFLAVUS301_31110 [Xanthobacter flavus]|uniref:Uncharacterized protein n=1 Tax=Xanthobacter flavus TaxID=281 RepID=A0A9W6CQH7_XANFL|nr:hypothetical protein XFLAVUS301_31110 [Xanthobacter flavus]